MILHCLAVVIDRERLLVSERAVLYNGEMFCEACYVFIVSFGVMLYCTCEI